MVTQGPYTHDPKRLTDRNHSKFSPLRTRLLKAAALALLIHPAVDAAEIDGTPQKWHKVSLTFQHDEVLSETSTEVNPFLDFRLQVLFEHGDSDASYDVPGFYAADGAAADTSAASGDKWRVHFTPDRSGTWSWSVSFRTGDDVAIDSDPLAGQPASFDGESGTFVVGTADHASPGLVKHGRLNYVGGHFLQFEESGEYYLKNGVDSPENLLGYYEFDNTYDLGGQDNDLHSNAYGDGLHHYDAHLGDFQAGDPTWLGGGSQPKGQRILGALNYLESRGINTVYFLTYNVDQGDGMEVWPWVDSNVKATFDVSKLAQWERVLDHMTNRGIVLHVVTQETENNNAINGGNLGVERMLYYRELIARFSHNLGLIWNLGEENTNTTEQRKDFANFIRDVDPYDHPIVIHTYPYQIDSVYPPLLGFDALEGPSSRSTSTRCTAAPSSSSTTRRPPGVRGSSATTSRSRRTRASCRTSTTSGTTTTGVGCCTATSWRRGVAWSGTSATPTRTATSTARTGARATTCGA